MSQNILWITPIAPAFAAGGGGEIRQAHLIDALADHFDISLLVAGRVTDQRLRDRVQAVHEISARPQGDPPTRLQRRIRDLRWQVLSRQADEVARLDPVRQALTSALQTLPHPDLVCVEYLGLAALLPRRRTVPWSITLHNLPSEMARHNAALAPGRRQRAMLALEQRNAQRLERWAAANYDLTVAVSPDDAERLSGKVKVVPNGVDVERFRITALPHDPRVVFTGALHTLPNRDGVGWLCREVWPRVLGRRADATLEVVGSKPPAEVHAAAQVAGVSVHADVPDVRTHIERARVAVVPLRIGSGSRLKALEAMAAGRPLVGTEIGLGGIDLQDGHHALIADDAEGFAQAIVRCLDDDELAGSLAAAGRRLAEVRYCWPAIGRGYRAALEDALAVFRAPG